MLLRDRFEKEMERLRKSSREAEETEAVTAKAQQEVDASGAHIISLRKQARSFKHETALPE